MCRPFALVEARRSDDGRREGQGCEREMQRPQPPTRNGSEEQQKGRERERENRSMRKPGSQDQRDEQRRGDGNKHTVSDAELAAHDYENAGRRCADAAQPKPGSCPDAHTRSPASRRRRSRNGRELVT
jgi:hypothetical protein